MHVYFDDYVSLNSSQIKCLGQVLYLKTKHEFYVEKHFWKCAFMREYFRASHR